MNLYNFNIKVNHSLLKLPGCIVIILVFFSGTSTDVLAVEWSVTPKVELRNEYDTNRSLTAATHESVTGVSLAPVMVINRETGISKNKLTARLRSTRYSDEQIEDSNVQLLKYKHQSRGLRNTFKIDADFRGDTTLATFNDIEFDEDDIDDQGPDLGGVSDSDLGLTEVTVKRKNLRIDPKWSYKLSESYVLGVSLRYRSLDYSGEANTGLVEFNSNTYAVSLFKSIDEKNAFSYEVKYSEFDPADDLKSEDRSIGLSYRYKYSDSSSLGLAAGVRDTESPDGNSDGTVFRVGYKTRSEVSRLKLEITRDLAGSGTGSVVERLQLELQYKHRLSELNILSIRVRAFDTESVDNNVTANREYISIEPRLDLRLSRNFSVDFSYRYREKRTGSGSQEADSKAAFLGVVYNFKKISSRI